MKKNQNKTVELIRSSNESLTVIARAEDSLTWE